MKFILSPPLRNVREQDKLWCGISDGAIDVVASRSLHLLDGSNALQISKGDFSRCPNGLPGVENRIQQLLFSSGVMTGRISPERFVELTSAMPARVVWPVAAKGLLAPGSDGDVSDYRPTSEPTNSASPSPRQR